MDYTDSIAWEKSMRLAESVVALCPRLPAGERFGIRQQMTRAATSVPSNIAEGWVRESWREKIQFLSIAHGSLAELHTQLLICARTGWLSAEDIRASCGLASEIARMLTTLKTRWRRMPARRVTRPTIT
jgi:four helix bundle protein